jgi:hypothetical protein
MPPELQELYNLYQQELNTRQSEKEANFLSELNTMLRVQILGIYLFPPCCGPLTVKS